MIPFHKSIGFRLLGVSFILLALPLLVDSFVLVQKRYERTTASAKAHLVDIASLREMPLSQIQPLNIPLIEVLIQNLKLESAFPESVSKELNEKLKKIARVGNFYNIFLLKKTPEGRLIVVASGTPDFIGKDLTDFFKLYTFYNVPSLEEGYASYITFDEKTLHPYFIVAHAIYSLKLGGTAGMIAIQDDLTAKISDLLSPDKHPYQVNFALLLPSTIVFEASDPEMKFQYFSPLIPEFRALLEKEEPFAAKRLPSKPLPVDNTIGFPFFEFTWQGQEQIGYIKQLPNSAYGLLAYASKDAIFQAPLLNFFNIYSTYGLILVVGGTLATLLTMRMAKPIQDLSLVMQKIQQKDLNIRYKKDPLGFEINELGIIFNEMVDKVLEQKHVAEEERVNRETLARELKLGQQVQRSLLPQMMPQYPGVDLAEIYIPAIEVGGDFYDVYVKDHEMPQLILAVADASGKGVQACFYSLSVRNILRTYSKEHKDIAQAMVATNNLFNKDTGDTGMFVTVLAGIYNCQTKVLNYYSCGHNPGLVRRNDGSVEMLQSVGMAMGVLPAQEAISHFIQLQTGDVVIFYSDGITEAHDENFENYGEKRLIECLQREGTKKAAAIVESIVADVTRFVGTAPQHDDITLLVMKIIA